MKKSDSTISVITVQAHHHESVVTEIAYPHMTVSVLHRNADLDDEWTLENFHIFSQSDNPFAGYRYASRWMTVSVPLRKISHRALKSILARFELMTMKFKGHHINGTLHAPQTEVAHKPPTPWDFPWSPLLMEKSESVKNQSFKSRRVLSGHVHEGFSMERARALLGSSEQAGMPVKPKAAPVLKRNLVERKQSLRDIVQTPIYGASPVRAGNRTASHVRLHQLSRLRDPRLDELSIHAETLPKRTDKLPQKPFWHGSSKSVISAVPRRDGTKLNGRSSPVSVPRTESAPRTSAKNNASMEQVESLAPSSGALGSIKSIVSHANEGSEEQIHNANGRRASVSSDVPRPWSRFHKTKMLPQSMVKSQFLHLASSAVLGQPSPPPMKASRQKVSSLTKDMILLLISVPPLHSGAQTVCPSSKRLA
ncbi:hypothetical protein K402DRAFT_237408 [Aulographum hederae CBS 113979]|uniref:Uncharacterized protein n=1 Tax=Aulographum hederae CBS 113979 TaxID=1176131 RepID=A0A6G1GK57_9PEZI|nr:hypothetical protein K402DRAFT_237408 [Aulographum hederae CBS 113979]